MGDFAGRGLAEVLEELLGSLVRVGVEMATGSAGGAGTDAAGFKNHDPPAGVPQMHRCRQSRDAGPNDENIRFHVAFERRIGRPVRSGGVMPVRIR